MRRTGVSPQGPHSLEDRPPTGPPSTLANSLWLQLGEEPTVRSGAQVVVRFGVDDAGRERQRLEQLGVAVGPLEHVPEAVNYFDFRDLDGNVLSFYSEIT